MGLDMYLQAEKYVGGWNLSSESEKAQYAALVKARELTPTKDSPSFYVRATVGYWRKANAIHKWFVDNVQNGRDECQESPVSRDQLRALRDVCAKVISQPGIAPATLPTQSGCFFGSTDYDEYYLSDLRDTVEIINRVLADKALEDCEFFYRASW